MKRGFSLIELLVVMAILIIIIGIPYNFFIRQLRTTVKETSISRLSIETLQSLSVLRKDIELAGYGLLWDTRGATYSEASSNTPDLYSINSNTFNDAPNEAPRAIVGKVDTEKDGFAYLVLKSTAFGLNKAVYHWTYIDREGLNIWPINNSANYNNLKSGDRVVIFDATLRRLIKNENDDTFYYTVSKDATASDTDPENYGLPKPLTGTYLVYGVDTSNPRAPFNRIDYFLYDSDSTPTECASGTHTLARGLLSHSNGGIQKYPLINCVADFQVVFGLDTDKDGAIDSWAQDITSKKAKEIRRELKQIRVYLLVQAGKRDVNFTYPHDKVLVGEVINGNIVGREFNLSNIEDYKHYRWQLVKMVLTPKNLE